MSEFHSVWGMALSLGVFGGGGDIDQEEVSATLVSPEPTALCQAPPVPLSKLGVGRPNGTSPTRPAV